MLGPALLGVAQAVAVWLMVPDSRRVSDIAWALLVGTGFGLVMFGPIALAVLTRERCPDWLHRYGFFVNWHTSIAMGLSLGYLVASIRHDLFEDLAIVAFGIVLFGAVLKIALNDALRQKKQDRT
jgi:hypothetical protein